MKRKASSSSIFKKERNIIPLSMEMIVSILLLLLPTSVHGFSLIGNEPARTRTYGTKSTYSDPISSSHRGVTLRSAYRNRNMDHIFLDAPTSSPALSKDEQAVDEYLEFLDRRYRRLHEDRPSNEFANLPSSVWKWLHSEDGSSMDNHATSSTTTSNPATNTEDALYVLGVAGLASKKLLQKHHLTTSTTTASSVSDSKVVSDNAKATAIDVGYTNTSAAAALTTETLAQTLIRLLVNRKALIEYQRKQLKEMVALVFVRGPTHMIRSLWKFCDGTRFVKRTILMTITLSFLIFRTVSFIIANESA